MTTVAYGYNTTRRDILSLYLLRFICALMIVVHHTWPYFFGYSISAISHYELDAAVDFFFILSGMMMYYIYPIITDKSSFLIQRAGKLLPLHWLTAGTFLLFISVPAFQIIFANLFCFQSFIPWAEYYHSLNGVAWCVCAELFFYICYAIGSKNIFKSLTICILINALIWIICSKYSLLFNSLGIVREGVVKFLPPARVFQFFAGCITAYFIKKQRDLKSLSLSNMLVILGILLILVSGQYVSFVNLYWLNRFIIQYYRTALMCVGIFLCCYRCTIIPEKPIAFLGKISFAIFMTHSLVIHLFSFRKLFLSQPGYIRYMIYCAVVFVCSWLGYKYIEQPAYRWVKKNIQNIKHVLGSIKLNLIYPCLILAGLSAVVFFPTEKNDFVNLSFKMNYTAEKQSPYIKVYYAAETKNSFAEKYSVFVPKKMFADGNFQVPIQTNVMHNFRLSFLDFQEITLSDVYVSGKRIYPVSFADIKSVDADVSITDNSINIKQLKPHSYIIFKDFQSVQGKTKFNPIIFWWFIWFFMGYFVLFNIGYNLKQKYRIVKTDAL